MNVRLPNHVVLQGRGLNHAGAGRAPGSHAYVDPGRGNVLELFFAEVIQVGHLFGLCRVANNTAMPTVRVDHGLLNGAASLSVGQVLLIGPLAYEGAGPKAQGAWLVNGNGHRNHNGAAVEKFGQVWILKAGYGFIKPADGGANAFFHFSECVGFAPMVGMHVRYTPRTDPRGPKAFGVRPV
jgi:cold shock CspA family protein